MANDYIIVGGELKHYGVLGMKWGVRRNPSKAYAKASDKLKKLDAKIDKKTVKARKASDKADRKQFGFATPSSRAKAARKARMANYKVAKTTRKALKWERSMEKAFANTSVSMHKSQIELGKKYLKYLDDRGTSRY